MTEMQRKSIFYQIFGKDEARFIEQEKVIYWLPLVNLKIEAFVQGEDDIVVVDIFTWKLRVDRKNL